MEVLDRATLKQRQINEAIASLKVTRVLIAHRPQTIAIADWVLCVGGGRIVEVPASEERVTAAHLSAVA
jgi:ATP-binding cassette subfamily B protein RaxB